MIANSALSESAKNKLVKMVCDAIIEAVRAAGPLGAPAGHIYAALMQHGFTFEQFATIMGTLVRVGQLRRSGECYFIRGGDL